MPCIYDARSRQLTDMVEVVTVVLTFVCIVQSVHASWWYLGIASSALEADTAYMEFDCDSMPYLAPRQRELCGTSRNMLDVISEGASMAIDECQHEFRDRRWNCTTFNETTVFGKVLNIKSRETAYIYSIQSAGVMYAITRACAKGELDHCGCDPNIRNVDTEQEFEWGGCSHNVKYGEKFTKEFVDTSEMKLSASGMMNLWNNQAGRKGIHHNMKLLCKCHGVSGSCSIKICWRTMPPFRTIGGFLKDRFDGASKVKFNKKQTKLRPVSKRQKRPTKKDLVYLEESPDYCNYNPTHGSMGTTGRQCNQTSIGLDGCKLMCCGRGYYTIVRDIKEDCDCKFFWCCRVVCKKCTKVLEEHFCN